MSGTRGAPVRSGGRRGFTLVELLVVVVLGMIVLAAAYQILITNQRTYTAQSAVIQGQQSARMALDLMFAELREVSPAGGDLVTMDTDSIRIRLMRNMGIVCEVDFSGDPTLTVLNHSGDRFATGDSVFIFADNDERDDDDDTWIRASVVTVDTTETCLSGQPASDLVFTGQDALFTADSVRVGAMVRDFQYLTYGETNFGGDIYLGRCCDFGFMWPMVGPLRRTDGLQFRYLDANGNTTAVATNVRQIVVDIRTGGEVRNSRNQMVMDSINTWIYTRN